MADSPTPVLTEGARDAIRQEAIYEQSVAERRQVERALTVDVRTHPDYDVDQWERLAHREARAGRNLAEAASMMSAAAYEEIKEIRADPSLSAQGKIERIMARRAEAEAAAHAFLAVEQVQYETEVAELNRALRRPEPMTTGRDRLQVDLSFRDALDRAEAAAKKGTIELGELLDRAEITGDSILARAAFSVAIDRDPAVTERWLRNHPDDAPKLNRLRELHASRSGVQALVRGIQFRDAR